MQLVRVITALVCIALNACTTARLVGASNPIISDDKHDYIDIRLMIQKKPQNTGNLGDQSLISSSSPRELILINTTNLDFEFHSVRIPAGLGVLLSPPMLSELSNFKNEFKGKLLSLAMTISSVGDSDSIWVIKDAKK